MAGVLEKREKKTYLDDTTPLTVTIVTNRMRDTHVVSYNLCHHYNFGYIPLLRNKQ